MPAPAALLLVLLAAAEAGGAPAPGTTGPEPAQAEAPERDPARSVYRLRPLDVPLTVLTTGAAIVPNVFASRLIHPSCPCDRSDVNGFDAIALGQHSRAADLLSDATVAAAVLAPALAGGLRLGFTSRAFGEDLVILAETLSVNAALVVGAKYLVQRPLPVTYDNRDGLQRQAQGYRSFWSGHTSTAVASLAAWAWTAHLREGPAAWRWVVVGAVGAAVGTERVLAGRHFPTDVLAGAAAGLAVGTAVPLLHARRGPSWSLGPLPASGRGAAVSVAF